MKDQQCKVIDRVQQLTESGDFEFLNKAGLLLSKATTYRDMYLKFQAYLVQGFSRKKAVEAVASHFRYEDERTVYRAISLMELEID